MAEVEGKGNVTVDLEKYTELVLKVDEAQDKINEMETLRKELKIATAAAKPVERFSFGALFRDENDINEKAIVGFASFIIMVIFALADLITGYFGEDLVINEVIYNSFVIVTLGSFGISSIEKIKGSN